MLLCVGICSSSMSAKNCKLDLRPDCHVDSELSREGLRRLRSPSSWTGLLELGCGFIGHGDFDAVLQAARAILLPLHRNPVSSALRAMPLLQRRSYRMKSRQLQ